MVVVAVGVVGVGHQVGGEQVDGEVVPPNSGSAEAFLDENLAVKTPEGAPDTKGGELNGLERVSTEDGEAGTSQR